MREERGKEKNKGRLEGRREKQPERIFTGTKGTKTKMCNGSSLNRQLKDLGNCVEFLRFGGLCFVKKSTKEISFVHNINWPSWAWWLAWNHL